MQRTHIAEISLESQGAIRICGFVERIRVLKNVAFLIIRDATGKVQVTIDPSAEEQLALYEQVKMLTAESVVEFEGVIQANTSVKFRGMELIPSKLVIHSAAEENKPIDEKTNSSDRMDWRFLDLRSQRNLLIFKVQTAIEAAMREFWLMRKFIEIHSPKFMASPSESKAELFEVKYFEGVAYLAQSPQFYKQMAMASGFERVFEIGPVFRANPSHTVRHDTEFTSVDSEMSFIDSHEDVMAFEEEWIAYVLKRVKEQYGEEIQKEFGIDIFVPALPFPRITMAEAQEQLRKENYTCERVGDLDPEGERRVCAHIKKKFGHEFVFVTDYPIDVRPFYHMRHPDNPSLTRSFDLLWKGIEVTTGAQREHRYDVLLSQVNEKGLNPEGIKFYLDFFRYGMPPHGGFGFGLTRMLMVLLGLANVREVTFLYRGVNRLTP